MVKWCTDDEIVCLEFDSNKTMWNIYKTSNDQIVFSSKKMAKCPTDISGNDWQFHLPWKGKVDSIKCNGKYINSDFVQYSFQNKFQPDICFIVYLLQ